jgi:hypothetical protein
MCKFTSLHRGSPDADIARDAAMKPRDWRNAFSTGSTGLSPLRSIMPDTSALAELLHFGRARLDNRYCNFPEAEVGSCEVICGCFNI